MLVAPAYLDNAGVVDGEHEKSIGVTVRRNVATLVSILDGSEDVQADGTFLGQIFAKGVVAD